MFYDFSWKKIYIFIPIALLLSASVFLTTIMVKNLDDDFFRVNLTEAKMAFNTFTYKVDFAQTNGKSLAASIFSSFLDNNATQQFNGDNAQSIPVLLYHGIVKESDGSNILLEDFKNQMFVLKKAGWQTINIEDFDQFMKGEKDLPDKSFLLTFDDGRKDSYYPVDSILRALNYEAVIFISTGKSLIEDSNNFFLSERELKRMTESGRWDIQVHAKNGHNLYKIDESGLVGHFYSNRLWLDEYGRLETQQEFTARIRQDMSEAKNELESELGIKSIGFAFPFGDFGQQNFPGIQRIVLETVESLYSLAFYQTWPDNGFTTNIKNESEFMTRRLNIELEWKAENLLEVLENGREKVLPYKANFEENDGWIKKWGEMSIENNLKISPSLGKTSATVILDGSYSWQDYIFNSKISLEKGETFTLLGRFKDDRNFAACVYSDKSIRVEQTVDGEKKILKEWKDNFNFTGGTHEVGIAFNGNVVDCYLNGRIVVRSYNLDETLGYGGIGFKTWDQEVNNSELVIKEIDVEKYRK